MSQPKNILVLTYWKFDDALIQTYTLPYLRIIRDILPAGSKIFLVTLEPQGAGKKIVEVESGIQRFSFQLHPFGLKAMLAWRKNISFLCDFVRTMKIQFVHTWCTPAGAIGYFVSKRTGIPLVLDSYEPHAEPMAETGTWSKGGLAHRILFRLERKQSQHAKWRIGVVSKMRDYAKEKYDVDADNFLVKPACIDLELFRPQKDRNELRLQLGFKEDEIVCVCAAKFGGLYLTDEAFMFFRDCANGPWKEKFRVLLLTSTPKEEIEKMCKAVDVDPKLVHSVFVPHAWVPKYMSAADFAFSPFKSVPSRRYCTPIKNGEYWAMGLPTVITPGISDDSDLIRENTAGFVIRHFSPEDSLSAVAEIDRLLSGNREELTQRIRALAEKHRNFAIAKEVYRKIYTDV